MIHVERITPPPANPNNNDEEVICKNCAPFTDYIIDAGAIVNFHGANSSTSFKFQQKN